MHALRPSLPLGSTRATCAGFILLLSLLATLLPMTVQAHRADLIKSGKPSSLAQVRFIQHALGVRPPRQREKSGRVNQQLFNAYFLRTKQKDKASIKFGDGTVLHINSRTDLVLKNAHLTQIQQGEIDQIVQPGTVHQVQAATAIAAAIGTEFDIKEIKATHDQGRGKHRKKGHKARTIITVIEGALVVDTPQGKATVKTNQQVNIVAGEKPHKPVPVEAKKTVTWTRPIPPVQGRKENIALDANGGRVIAWSSQASSAPLATRSDARQIGSAGDARRINDGSLDTGWATARGKIANEWIKLAFPKEETYSVNGVVIDPSATSGFPAGDALKKFEIRISTTDSKSKSFDTVYRGTTEPGVQLQRFLFPRAVPARYMELVVVSNYSGRDRVAVAELEAISAGKVIVPPAPTPTATATNTSTPTDTPVPTDTAVPPTATATFTATPTATATFTLTPTATLTPTVTATTAPTNTFTPVVPTLVPANPTVTPTPCLAPSCY